MTQNTDRIFNEKFIPSPYGAYGFKLGAGNRMVVGFIRCFARVTEIFLIPQSLLRIFLKKFFAPHMHHCDCDFRISALRV